MSIDRSLWLNFNARSETSLLLWGDQSGLKHTPNGHSSKLKHNNITTAQQERDDDKQNLLTFHNHQYRS